VAKEPIPYSGTGWKRVEEQESCFGRCVLSPRQKRQEINSFPQCGRGGVVPVGNLQQVGGDWGVVPVSVVRADKVQEAAY
jgi:hypothetical protein